MQPRAQAQIRGDYAPDAYLPGTHLVTARDGYSHHGIYVGRGRVIHYGGFCDALHAAPVEEISLEAFAHGNPVTVKPEPFARYLGAQAVHRARSRLGEDRYHLLTNNCEHFCTWCVRGVARSEQVEACIRHPREGMQVALLLLRRVLPSGLTIEAGTVASAA